MEAKWMFPEQWCMLAEECVNSSLDMGRGEGLVEDREVKQQYRK